VGYGKWLWAYKTGNISKTVEDRVKDKEATGILLMAYIKSYMAYNCCQNV